MAFQILLTISVSSIVILAISDGKIPGAIALTSLQWAFASTGLLVTYP